MLSIGKLFAPDPCSLFRGWLYIITLLGDYLQTICSGLSYVDCHKLRLSVKCVIGGAIVA